MVALFLLSVSPALVTLGWHLIHGNAIQRQREESVCAIYMDGLD